MEVKIEKRGNVEGLSIFLPLESRPFPMSSTGKSLTIASSRGVKLTNVTVEGESLNVGVNAYINNRGFVKQPKG